MRNEIEIYQRKIKEKTKLKCLSIRKQLNFKENLLLLTDLTGKVKKLRVLERKQSDMINEYQLSVVKGETFFDSLHAKFKENTLTYKALADENDSLQLQVKFLTSSLNKYSNSKSILSTDFETWESAHDSLFLKSHESKSIKLQTHDIPTSPLPNINLTTSSYKEYKLPKKNLH